MVPAVGARGVVPHGGEHEVAVHGAVVPVALDGQFDEAAFGGEGAQGFLAVGVGDEEVFAVGQGAHAPAQGGGGGVSQFVAGAAQAHEFAAFFTVAQQAAQLGALAAL